MHPLRLILSSLLLTTLLPLYGQVTSSALQTITQAEAQYHARVGVVLMRQSNHQILIAHREQESFCPASLTKILSTGRLLRERGRDYRFTTQIYTQGPQLGKRLEGDLIIVGSGDPSIASAYIPGQEERFVDELSALLQTRGIEQIEGRLIVDASRLPKLGIEPTWLIEDVGEYYGTGVYGFNYQDNYLRIPAQVTSAGIELHIPRGAQSLEWNNDLEPGEKWSYTATSYPMVGQIKLSGSFPSHSSTHTLRIANPQPVHYAAHTLRQQLQERNIQIEGGDSVTLTPILNPGISLGSYQSLPIDTLIRITNFRSSNLYAEALGRSVYHDDDSSSTALYWQTELSLPPHSLKLYDSSGLSRKNRITPSVLAKVLNLLSTEEAEHNAFVQSLPLLGREGSVSSWMPQTTLQARLKSGSMEGIAGYAGYVWHEGELYTLVILSNDFPSKDIAKSVFEKFLTQAFGIHQPSRGKSKHTQHKSRRKS